MEDTLNIRQSNVIWFNFAEAGQRTSCSIKGQQQSLEDWRRFYVIQLHIYLSQKRSRRIGTNAEKDMVHDLLSLYWEEIVSSGVLDGLGLLEKIRFFSEIRIDFPLIDGLCERPATASFIPFKG
jgi:hypothetical protein